MEGKRALHRRTKQLYRETTYYSSAQRTGMALTEGRGCSLRGIERLAKVWKYVSGMRFQ